MALRGAIAGKIVSVNAQVTGEPAAGCQVAQVLVDRPLSL